MKTRNRLIALITTLTLLMTAAAFTSGPVTGHSTGSSHFIGDCPGDVPPASARGFIWTRNTSSVGTLLGVRVLIVTRTLAPCIDGNWSDHISKTFLLASLEGTLGGYDNFVQIGLARQNNGTTDYCNAGQSGGDRWIEGNTTFVWTGRGSNSGVLCQAYWVDFNNDGVMDIPVSGRTYDYAIAKVYATHGPSTNWWWRYRITDTVTGNTDYIDQAINGNSESSPLSGSAWWGCEAGTTANALGTPEGSAQARMIESGYKKSSTDSWFVTENSTAFSPGSWNSLPNYYRIDGNQDGLGEKKWCYTESHQ